MSWTSEFEPPPPRPGDDNDEFPEDGPLDPSVFDGLFDDLLGPDPADEEPASDPGEPAADEAAEPAPEPPAEPAPGGEQRSESIDPDDLPQVKAVPVDRGPDPISTVDLAAILDDLVFEEVVDSGDLVGGDEQVEIEADVVGGRRLD
ncbi:MAG: hypothetical protein AAF547_21410 [Actinomycetota bacterium]